MSVKHKVRHVLEAFYGTEWALSPEKLEQIAELVELRRDGGLLTEDEIRLRIAGRRERDYDETERYHLDENGVAVLPVYGVMAPKMNLMAEISGGVSTQELIRSIEQAAGDPEVRALVLDIDSPGGSAYGVAEAASALRKLRQTKPAIAVANHQAASGAYWLASSASEIVATPSSMLGSIGVYGVHRDASAAYAAQGIKNTILKAGNNKAAANPYEPLSPERRAVLQESIDDYYRLFLDEVAAGRGVSAEIVEKSFGQGKSMVASRAVAAGLADRIGTISEVIAELGARVRPSARGPQAGPRAQEETSMDPKLMEALRRAGLIGGEATKGEAQAALSAWFAAKGRGIPMAEGAFDVAGIEKALAEKPETKVEAKTETKAEELRIVAATLIAPTALLEPAKDQKDLEKVRAEERDRINEIRVRGKLLGGDETKIQDAIDAGTSLADFLVATTAAKAAKEGPVPKVETGRAACEKFSAAAVDAICSRGGVKIEKPAEGCRELRYHTLLELAKESFRVSCGRTPIGDPNTIAAAALGDPQAMRDLGLMAGDVPFQTPGDFPNILSAAASKTLEAAPEYVGTTYQRWAYKKPSVPDFKPSTLVRFGEFGEFAHHVDGDDFEQSELSEDYAWIQVDSYGDEFGLTPVMMVNDDLGAFMEALADKQAAHDQTLNRLCVNLLTGNVAAADGVALFHLISHGNDRAAGAAPSTAELAAMRLLLRKQTGVGGLRKLAYTLNLLLIPEDLETTTQQLLAATLGIYPVTEGATPIFKGQVDWAVEPMLADSSTARYYGFANPQQARSIVYCHQRGFERMVSRNYYNPKNNCRMFQFEGRFAAAINNYRGVVRNAGTGA